VTAHGQPSPTPQGARDDVREASVGELIGDVSRDMSALLRQELELAKAELRAEVGKTGRAAGMLGGAGFAGYMTLLFLSVAAWAALDRVMPAGWAAVVVAAIWAVAGAVLAARGRTTLRAVHPRPERTVQTVQQIPNAFTSR
jgi:hypothetical protein